MSKSKRLQIVLDLAEQAEHDAAEAFEMARKLKIQDEQKLYELNQFYEDYEMDFRRPQPFLRAEEMQRQRGFLVQLCEARDQQQQILEHRTKVLESKQTLWQTAHLKRKALNDLIERLKLDEARELDKKEEKMLDEWFAQTAQQRIERSV